MTKVKMGLAVGIVTRYDARDDVMAPEPAMVLGPVIALVGDHLVRAAPD